MWFPTISLSDRKPSAMSSNMTHGSWGEKKIDKTTNRGKSKTNDERSTLTTSTMAARSTARARQRAPKVVEVTEEQIAAMWDRANGTFDYNPTPNPNQK